MTITIDLTKEDLIKLNAEKKIITNAELIYKDNKVDDFALFKKIVKNQRKKHKK